MRCLNAFGERIMARDPDRQTAEIHIRIALMNRLNALGTAEIVRVAYSQRGKGRSRLRQGIMQQRRPDPPLHTSHYGPSGGTNINNCQSRAET